MTVLRSDIDSYIASIRYANSEFTYLAAKRMKLGDKYTNCINIKATLLAYYVRILEDYFDKTDYENNNFFTVEEATDIMVAINDICDTNYFLVIT